MALTVPAFRAAFPEFGDPAVYSDSQVNGWIAQVAGLRAAFPEFASTDTYPDLTAAYWIATGNLQLSASRFGTSLALAIRLFAAHNIVLAARAAASGAAPGSAGIASSKSVGGVSVSYDTTLTASQGAGFYNATSYGQRFWGMLRAFGTGPLYVPQTTSPGRYPYGYRPF